MPHMVRIKSDFTLLFMNSPLRHVEFDLQQKKFLNSSDMIGKEKFPLTTSGRSGPSCISDKHKIGHNLEEKYFREFKMAGSVVAPSMVLL